MCSFTVLSKKYDNNLLHITGKKTIQPIIKDNIVVLFNGEIYNYKDLGNFSNELDLLHNLYNKDFIINI